jgi:hypothetical protein
VHWANTFSGGGWGDKIEFSNWDDEASWIVLSKLSRLTCPCACACVGVCRVTQKEVQKTGGEYYGPKQFKRLQEYGSRNVSVMNEFWQRYD